MGSVHAGKTTTTKNISHSYSAHLHSSKCIGNGGTNLPIEVHVHTSEICRHPRHPNDRTMEKNGRFNSC